MPNATMYQALRRALAAALALSLALPALSAPPAARAATFTVTKTADTNDGACNSDCSLREAVIAANAAPGADEIRLTAGTYILSRPADGTPDDGADGDLDITGPLTISGAGPATTIISATAVFTDRIAHVLAPAAATLSGLTVRGGFAGYALSNPALTGNGGGVLVDIGAALTLRDSHVTRNRARRGGGIGAYGSVTVTGSAISANQSVSAGAGVDMIDFDTRDALTPGPLALLNTTVSGNSSGFSGGGVAVFDSSATFTSVTVVGNTADDNADGGGDGGGILVGDRNPSVTLTGTIVAGNSDRSPATANVAPDCGGRLTSLGYNLVQSEAGCFIVGVRLGDLSGVPPQLGPLQDNGGPSPSHAPLTGSPAIDAGDPTVGGGCPAADQRGAARPADGDGAGGARCDIGAVEVAPSDLRFGVGGVAIGVDNRVTYAISVGNAGPNAATGVAVRAPLPAGAGFGSFTGSGWSCAAAGGVVTCSLGALASGRDAPPLTLTLVAPAAASSLTVTFTLVSSVADTTPGDGSISVTATRAASREVFVPLVVSE